MSWSVLSGNVHLGIMKYLLLLLFFDKGRIKIYSIASLVATSTKNYVINKDISQTLRWLHAFDHIYMEKAHYKFLIIINIIIK